MTHYRADRLELVFKGFPYVKYEGVDGRTLMDESGLSQNAIRMRRVGQRPVGV